MLFFTRGTAWTGCSFHEGLCGLVVLHERSCVVQLRSVLVHTLRYSISVDVHDTMYGDVHATVVIFD